MTQRTLQLTLTLTVRNMTEAEFTEAGGYEYATDEHDSGPDNWVEQLDPSDLNEAIQGALNSDGNPEMFAGSSLFLVTQDAVVVTAEWKAD